VQENGKLFVMEALDLTGAKPALIPDQPVVLRPSSR
jgi:hypothetical protein